MPFLVENYNLTFGFFTKFLIGEVRNPAIASSAAIVISTILGIILQFLPKKEQKL